jgi:asparagine synthase (glutamine-hydrolysing)
LIKVNFEPTYLEIINDINGIEQIFYWRQGEQWILSNSIYLINKIKKLNGSFDFLGISSWLTQGFVGFNRTLKSGIKVIPNGQVWSWKSNDSEPKKENYFSISKLACSDRHEISHEKIEQLAEKMTFVQKILFKNFKCLESRLTGGLDSRVLVALNEFSGYSGKYYTFGNLSPADNLVSEKIVKNFRLSHKFYYIDIEEEFKNWQNYWWYLLRQNDGMVDYKEILFPDAKRLPKSVDRLNLTLHGGAGAIGKTFYYNSDIFEKPTENIIVKKFAEKNFSYPINLIKIHTYERVINKIKDLVEFYLKDNVPLIEIPCCLFVDQRVRRWEGIISRVGDPLGDSFSPFWGRDFIEAAFTIQLYQLKRKMLHGNLIYILSPKLLNFPFDSYRKVPEISISKGGNLKVKIFQKSKNKIHKFSKILFQIKRKKVNYHFIGKENFSIIKLNILSNNILKMTNQ